jgi:hypothetical protein
MTIKSFIVPIISGLLWLLTAYAGVDGIIGIRERGADPSTGTIIWFVAVPLVMLGLAIASILVPLRTKSATVANMWSLFSIFLILPWAFLAGGV